VDKSGDESIGVGKLVRQVKPNGLTD